MYNFSFRRRFWPFSINIKNVAGHSYDPRTDKMWVSLASGGGREIIRWKECEVFLGADWKATADLFTGKIGKPESVK